jgi:hypothetical protein
MAIIAPQDADLLGLVSHFLQSQKITRTEYYRKMFSESFLAMSICVAIFIPRPFNTAATLRKRATAQVPRFPRNADNRSFPLNSKRSTDAGDSGPGPPYSFSHDLSRCVTQRHYGNPLTSTFCLCICFCICICLPPGCLSCIYAYVPDLLYAANKVLRNDNESMQRQWQLQWGWQRRCGGAVVGRAAVVTAAVQRPTVHVGSLNGDGMRMAILVARFNDIVTRPLMDGAVDAFTRHGVKASDITVSGLAVCARIYA